MHIVQNIFDITIDRREKMELKIEYLSKDILKPYANNAKSHPKEQIEQIKNSIREFGFNDPIAIWHDNEIIEGHGRLLASMEMPEIEKVPVIRLDSLTDEQRRAYMLVHNKITMNTGFDIDMISSEIESFTDIDLTDFGFSEAELLEFTVDDSKPEIPFFVPSETPGGTDNSESNGDYFSYTEPSNNDYFEESKKQFKEELDEYEKKANETITTKRVILIYRNDSEANLIKNFLGIPNDSILNVVYDMTKILEVKNAKSKE